METKYTKKNLKYNSILIHSDNDSFDIWYDIVLIKVREYSIPCTSKSENFLTLHLNCCNLKKALINEGFVWIINLSKFLKNVMMHIIYSLCTKILRIFVFCFNLPLLSPVLLAPRCKTLNIFFDCLSPFCS